LGQLPITLFKSLQCLLFEVFDLLSLVITDEAEFLVDLIGQGFNLRSAEKENNARKQALALDVPQIFEESIELLLT